MWICTYCTLYNNIEDSICVACGGNKPMLHMNEEKKTLYSAKEGCIYEYRIIDQFSELFHESIKEYNTPHAICGYATCAIATYIQETFPYAMSQEDITEMISKLRDSSLLSRIRNVMKFIQNSRQIYLDSDLGQQVIDKDHYMKDWVANYEISMFLNKTNNNNVTFIRTIERSDDIEYEELDRLIDEAPFFKEAFFFDSCSLENNMNSRENSSEWLKTHDKNTYDERKMVFICDGIGHFFVLKPTLLIDPISNSTQNIMLLLNTSGSLNLKKPIVSLFNELFFNRKIPPLFYEGLLSLP